jgi:hypothetical protein
MGVFVYWYGPDRYQKHSFIGTVGIEKWLGVELSNSKSTEWRGTVRLLGTVPVPVRTNKRTHPVVTSL